MSRNYSARSGDGDATSSNRKDPNATGQSASSSFRGRTDEETQRPARYVDFSRNCEHAGLEGPYGDSPPEHQRHYREEYFILMLNENEGSTPTSEYEHDQGLYNLKNDYIQKLNIVRRRLNLLDVNDESSNSTYRGCRITEIIEEGLPKADMQASDDEESLEKDVTNKVGGNSFPHNCEKHFKSDSNIHEIEYTPPKKKSCHRPKTPKLTTSDDSTVAYHTKICLRDDLFRNTPGFEENNFQNTQIWKGTIDKFTENKETQCTFESPYYSNQSYNTSTSHQESASLHSSLVVENEHRNLFPEVIIKEYLTGNISSSSASEVDISFPQNQLLYMTENNSLKNESSSIIQETDSYRRVTTPPKSTTKPSKTHSVITEMKSVFMNDIPNFVSDTTDEHYNTGSSSTTTILEKQLLPERKRIWTSRNKRHKLIPWENMKKTDNVKLRDRSDLRTKQYLANLENSHFNPKNEYTKGKTKRKREKRIGNIPFGPRAIVDGTGKRFLEHKYFYFSSDTDYHSSVFDSDRPATDRTMLTSCWNGLTHWFNRIFRK